MDTAIKILISQTNCTQKKAKEVIKKNNYDLDDALYCLLTNKEVFIEDEDDDSNLTESQKKIKELRKIVDVKDAYFCKIMESIKTQEQNNKAITSIKKNYSNKVVYFFKKFIYFKLLFLIFIPPPVCSKDSLDLRVAPSLFLVLVPPSHLIIPSLR